MGEDEGEGEAKRRPHHHRDQRSLVPTLTTSSPVTHKEEPFSLLEAHYRICHNFATVFAKEKNGMGLTNAKIQLRNPRLPELEAVEIDALADTGGGPPVHSAAHPTPVATRRDRYKRSDLGGRKPETRSLRRPDRVTLQEPDRVQRCPGHGRHALTGSNPQWKTWTWSSCQRQDKSSSIRSPQI